MSDDDCHEANPLDRIFVDEDDDRPDAIVVDELTTMDADEFVARLESLAKAADSLTTLAEDLESLRQTGLTDEDARDLIYGRNTGWAKRDIESMMDVVDDLVDGTTSQDPIVRLISDLSDLNLSETRELMDELERLHRLYGGLD